jgi:hypothetical protein
MDEVTDFRSRIWTWLSKPCFFHSRYECPRDPKATGLHIELIQCIYQSVLASQLPHKIFLLIFQLVMVNNELTILWGSCLAKIIDKYIH